MSQHTSTFGQPTGPVPPPVEEPTAVGSRRTVVLAVAGAVVALGAIGGAAALALISEEDAGTLAAPVPAATPSVEPSGEPSAAPTTPLPTAVVQGRNIFVPLLDAPANTDVAGSVDGLVEGSGEHSDTADGTTQELDAPPPTPATPALSEPPAPAASTAPSVDVVALEAQVARLTADVAGLTTVLNAPDTLTGAETEQLRGRLSDTEGELARVNTELAQARSTAAARQFSSVTVSVAEHTVPDSPADFIVTFTDGRAPMLSEDLKVGQKTEDGLFTYLNYDAETAEVTFHYVSSLITVRVGANLTV